MNHGNHLFCCFVDLQKAYDKVPRAHLMTALLDKLCIAPENFKFLVQMYTGIWAAVCIGGRFAPAFDMHEGVQQGYPASPLVFSLFIDRLEKHLVDGVLSHLSSREKQAIRIAGLLVP